MFWSLNIDGFVISQNLAQSRKGRKVNLLILKDIFLALLASLRENIVFTSSLPLTSGILGTFNFRHFFEEVD